MLHSLTIVLLHESRKLASVRSFFKKARSLIYSLSMEPLIASYFFWQALNS
jgi:hypothetical protein